jgi:hypothetical protein
MSACKTLAFVHRLPVVHLIEMNMAIPDRIRADVTILGLRLAPFYACSSQLPGICTETLPDNYFIGAINLHKQE